MSEPLPPVCDCGHPMEDHDAGECWWDITTGVQSDNVKGDRQCPCDWLSFTGNMWGPVGLAGGPEPEPEG